MPAALLLPAQWGHWLRVFQRYKLARRDGLHWSYARCLQIPDDASLARWEKQRTAQLERMKARAEKQAAE